MAITGDLGRVQGAGMFHTMAASGTSVARSSLQPQLTPLVGDAVQFSNGDVRQITGVSGETVTLGEVLFSQKGAPGIGNATLSDIDGDSTENGFTQAAVKGVAQAKNYYNLGAYDTYVSNGDGTGTVTRKTGYLYSGNVVANFKLAGNNRFAFILGNAPELASDDSSANALVRITCVLNVGGITATSADDFYNNQDPVGGFNKICVQQNGDITLITDGVQGETGNFVVQYLLPATYQYAEQVIDNQPIDPANQREKLYWHKEWQKGLNLIDDTTIKGQILPTSNSGQYYLPIKLSAGTYTNILVINGITDNRINTFGIYLQNGQQQNLLNISDTARPNTYKTFTVDEETASQVSGIYIYFNVSTGADYSGKTISGFMLTKGNGIYPYQPYNGELVHENRVPLYMTTDNTSPAQTIGGDWESLGNFTSGSNTIYVWRKL